MTSSAPRPVPVVLAELQEVRRHLRAAPPHHGAGVREALAQRQRALERELSRLPGTASTAGTDGES